MEYQKHSMLVMMMMTTMMIQLHPDWTARLQGALSCYLARHRRQ